MKIPWQQRLWVRIYATLVMFTLLLAGIGLFTWEALNDFPMFTLGDHGADRHNSGVFESRPHTPPDGHGPPPSALHRPAIGKDGRLESPPGSAKANTVGSGRPTPPVKIAVVMFALTSVAILIVAYPVARRIAHSIERIAAPVVAFGQGDLSARAPTDGPGEVGELGREFNEAADRVQSLIRSQQSLLANASHELRSPLARIQMQLEQIGVRSSVEIRADIRREIAELDALVEEILLSSKLQSEQHPKLTESVELLALIAEESARVGASADGVLTTVRGDSRLLRRVIRNMLENAVRYSGGSASVEALVNIADGAAHVDVLDRGPGVPETERERIFEPFYRARGASERSGGVGLGLSLAQQIAREHGGTLKCLPRDGGGHFRLTLPCDEKIRGAG